MKLEFTVYGTPQPQGSSRAFIPKGWNRAVITSDNPKLRSWRQELAKAALLACCHEKSCGFPLHHRIAVEVIVDFYFKPTKKVNTTYKTTRPDADKLLRAALDGMTGIVYTDDSQVSRASVTKNFGLPERVEIHVKDVT